MLRYRGFAYLPHFDDTDLHSQFLKFNNEKNDSIVSVSRGGVQWDNVTLSDWEEESKKYFTRFFKKRLNDVICVPQNENVVMATLKKWCDETRHRHGVLIVQNFDLSKQRKFLERENNVARWENSSQHSCSLVYHYYKNVILFLLRSENSKGTGNLEKEIESNIHNLIMLYQNELLNSGVQITVLVISDTEKQNFNFNCKFCKIFVVSISEFHTLSLDHWLENVNKQFNFSDHKLCQGKKNNFELFSAKMLSLMACTNYYSGLPNFTCDVDSQIKQVSLLLTPNQMDAIYSSKKHIILKGNYGTGKSIVMLKKLENLIKGIVKGINKDHIIYYFNYDGESNAVIELKNSVKEMYPEKCVKNEDNIVIQEKENGLILCEILIRENKNGLNLSGIFLSVAAEVGKGVNCAHIEVGKKVKCTHIFIDEFKGEDLTTAEVKELKEKIKKSFFEDAIIVIAAQSIETKIIDTFEGFDHPSIMGNLFEELKPTFDIEHLSYSMRNTKPISTLVEVVQNYFDNKQNNFTHFQSDLAAEKGAGDKTRNNINKDSYSSQRKKGISEEPLSLSPQRSKVVLIDHSDDLYQVLKEVSKTEADLDETAAISKTTGSYKFVKSKIGHDVGESKPKLIFLGNFGKTFEKICSLSAVLDMLEITENRVVIIHFERSSPSIL